MFMFMLLAVSDREVQILEVIMMMLFNDFSKKKSPEFIDFKEP